MNAITLKKVRRGRDALDVLEAQPARVAAGGSPGSGGRGGGVRRRHAHHCHPRRRAACPRPPARWQWPPRPARGGSRHAPSGPTSTARTARRPTTARRRPRCATGRRSHPWGWARSPARHAVGRALGLEEPEGVVELTGPGVDQLREVDRADLPRRHRVRRGRLARAPGRPRSSGCPPAGAAPTAASVTNPRTTGRVAPPRSTTNGVSTHRPVRPVEPAAGHEQLAVGVVVAGGDEGPRRQVTAERAACGCSSVVSSAGAWERACSTASRCADALGHTELPAPEPHEGGAEHQHEPEQAEEPRRQGGPQHASRLRHRGVAAGARPVSPRRPGAARVGVSPGRSAPGRSGRRSGRHGGFPGAATGARRPGAPGPVRHPRLPGAHGGARPRWCPPTAGSSRSATATTSADLRLGRPARPRPADPHHRHPLRHALVEARHDLARRARADPARGGGCRRPALRPGHQLRRLHDQRAARGPRRPRRDGGGRVRGRAAAAPSTAARRGCSSPTSTSGRAPSG